MAKAEKNQDKLNFAGDYVLDVAELLSYQIAQGGPGRGGEPMRIDIKNIIHSVELQENIFNNTLVGKIQVYDTQDVRTLLPITGLDKLNLAFSTPGITGPRMVANEGHPFHIYRLDTVAPEQTAVAHGQAYDIYFCSRESYYNNMRKVSKAYNGQVELAVEDIMINKKYLNSRKQFFVEKTKFPCKMVIPNLKPFAAIDMLARKAVSDKYMNAGYLFYETYDGYHFRSIESLLATNGSNIRPSRWKYQMQQQNIRHHTGSKDIMKDMHGAKSWSLNDPVNTLENLSAGAYANTLLEHDMFNKLVTTTQFDYDKEYNKHYHTEAGKDKTPLPKANFTGSGKPLNEEFDQRVFFKSSTSAIHSEFADDGVTSKVIPGVPGKYTTQKIVSQRKLLESGILTLNVPGLSLLHAGDIITFDMPLMRPLGHNVKQEMNPYWSGRYLIYNIKHMINRQRGEYTMQIKAFKDNVETAYPKEFEDWSHVAPQRETHSIYDMDAEVVNSFYGIT